METNMANITVSNSPSGLNLYFSDEIRQFILDHGGRAELKKVDDHTLVVSPTKNKGGGVSKNTGILPWRVQLEPAKGMAHFGVTPAEIVFKNGEMLLKLPTEKSAPTRKSARPGYQPSSVPLHRANGSGVQVRPSRGTTGISLVKAAVITAHGHLNAAENARKVRVPVKDFGKVISRDIVSEKHMKGEVITTEHGRFLIKNWFRPDLTEKQAAKLAATEIEGDVEAFKDTENTVAETPEAPTVSAEAVEAGETEVLESPHTVLTEMLQDANAAATEQVNAEAGIDRVTRTPSSPGLMVAVIEVDGVIYEFDVPADKAMKTVIDWVVQGYKR